jgi:formate hydrogenlyase subunit 6/NADH:ubiquinone oxidoreductase subunit I
MLCQGRCPIAGALLGEERPADPMRPGLDPVQVPVINAEQCVGCNQCMTACPMMPPAIGVDLPPYVGGSDGVPRMPPVRQ